jgi:septal ring factor EnvC (AmiA/AmiB activator)
VDPATIAAIAGLVSALTVGANKLLDFVLQRRRIAVDIEVQDRRAFSQETAAFRKELRDELTRLYARVDELERQHEEDRDTIDNQSQRIGQLEAHVRGQDTYISVLTTALRTGGYEVPPAPQGLHVP